MSEYIRDTALDKYDDPAQREVLLDMARSALTGYYLSPQVAERADYLEHSERTIELIRAFASGLMPEPAYHAGLLHDLPQREQSNNTDVSKAATERLNEYFNEDSMTETERDYISTLLADMRVVGRAAKAYRRKFAKIEADTNLTQDDLSLLANGSRKGRIPGHLWSVEEPEIGIKRMSKVAKRNNFESIVILAAEKIDHLQNPASSNESKLLHDILEAETFYAPLCEFWGLDAMAMTLKSAAAKRRLEKQAVFAASKTEDGIIEEQLEYIAINTANREYVKAARFGGPEKVMDMLYGAENCTRTFSVEPSLGKHPNQLAKFCEFNVQRHTRPMRVIGRIKSVGSLAKKMVNKDYRDSGKIPMDIIGLTSISSDVSELTISFRNALDRMYELEQSDRATLNRPASKSEPIYVQGGADFKTAVMIGLHDHPLIHRVEMKREDEPFQVAKFTAAFVNEEGISANVEMQFLTEEDRKKARLGVTSHALRKTMKLRREQERPMSEKQQSKLERRLSKIALRKSKVSKDRLELNERTKKRGKRMLARLALAHSDIIEK